MEGQTAFQRNHKLFLYMLVQMVNVVLKTMFFFLNGPFLILKYHRIVTFGLRHHVPHHFLLPRQFSRKMSGKHPESPSLHVCICVHVTHQLCAWLPQCVSVCVFYSCIHTLYRTLTSADVYVIVFTAYACNMWMHACMLGVFAVGPVLLMRRVCNGRFAVVLSLLSPQ